MVRLIDLQDNFAKTQAAERIAQIDRQKPDNDQQQFAQTMQEIALKEDETTEPLKEQDQIEWEEEEEKTAERQEREEKKRRKRKQKEGENKSTSKHIIDIKV